MPNEKRILLINDLPGYGKIALGAMIPILSRMGCQVFNLPTAVISNTLDYGKYQVLDTTDYMEGALRVWQALGFAFDAVSVGFIASARQAALIADFCREAAAKGALVFTDPIMADNGRFYNGMTEENAGWMRRLAAVSDVVFPNFTEACLMTGQPWEPAAGPGTPDRLLDGLLALGARAAVVTGVKTAEGCCVAGCDGESRFRVPYEEIPGRFPGTGDAFSAVLIGALLQGKGLEAAAGQAARAVAAMIRRSLAEGSTMKGLPVERYFDLLEG